MKLLTLFMISLTFASCGKLDDLAHGGKTIYKVEAAEEEPYSYQLIGKSCHTGEHEFTSFSAVCQGLRDNELNNDCAQEEREELFLNSECAGNFI